MKSLFKSYRIIAFASVIGISCTSLGMGVGPFIGTWSYYNEELSMGGTYIINPDSTYSVTMTRGENTIPNAETGTWVRGTFETTGSPSSIENNTTIVFTKSEGVRYTGRLAFNKLTVEGNIFTKQETE